MSYYTYFTGADAGGLWSDPGNWTDGVPGPGAIAVVSILSVTNVTLNNVSLIGVDVQGIASSLYGNAVGLTDSQITPLRNGDIDIHNSGLWLDKMSFIGVAPDNGGVTEKTWMNVYTPSIINQGVLGSEAPNSICEFVGGVTQGVNQVVVSYGQLLNAGYIIAANGGDTYLATENVTQVGSGTMSIRSGGTMEAYATIIQGGSISFGGADATTLRLSLNDTIGAVLAGFAVTDQIQLADFNLTSYSVTSLKNAPGLSTLHISGTDFITGMQGTLNLAFQGNFGSHLHVVSAPVNGLPGAKVFLS